MTPRIRRLTTARRAIDSPAAARQAVSIVSARARFPGRPKPRTPVSPSRLNPAACLSLRMRRL